MAKDRKKFAEYVERAERAQAAAARAAKQEAEARRVFEAAYARKAEAQAKAAEAAKAAREVSAQAGEAVAKALEPATRKLAESAAGPLRKAAGASMGRVLAKKSPARPAGLKSGHVRTGEPIGFHAGHILITDQKAGVVIGPDQKIVQLDEHDLAHVTQLVDLLATSHGQVHLVEGKRRLPVSGIALDTLMRVFSALEEGTSLTVLAGPDTETELTSQEAADLLNVSRPYVVKLAKDGVLPHRMVGNRHRFALADVLEYGEQMRATAEDALAQLSPAGGYQPGDF